MKLSSNGVRYSPSEIRAFTLLGKKPISTIELTEKIYNTSQRPYNDRQVVLSILTNLSRKVEVNKEPFAIRRDERRGPYPIKFWIEKR